MPSLPAEMKFNTSKKLLRNKSNFSRSALFNTKTRVSLKYPANGCSKTTRPKSHDTSVGAHQGKPPSRQGPRPYGLQQRRYHRPSLADDLATTRDQRVMRPHRRDPPKLSHHPAKPDGHRHCHATLQDHVAKASRQYS